MKPIAQALLRGMLLLLLAACAAAPPPAVPMAGEVEIVVTSNGWHSGIAVARDDLPPAAVPEAADFPAAAWFEFGWGDAEYYPAPDPSIGMALRAALQPSPAVVHLIGLPDAPEAVFADREAVRLALSRPALSRLIAHIAASFDRGGAPRAAPGPSGLYPFSRFYPATGRFHLFNNCNTWTARALAAAGLSMAPDSVVTAEDLMRQVRPLRR